MKKLNITLLMVLGLLLMVSCDSDRDSNPTISTPETFVLNIPPYAASDIDLYTSNTFELTCTQPDYGYTAAVVYSVQVSLDDTWNDATEDATATYATLETTFTTARLNAVASELDKGIVKVAGWEEEDDVPDGALTVFVRLKGHLGTGIYPVYSNSIELSVIPYYVELSDALPAPYYLLGSCIGDGTWNEHNLGLSVVPMALVEGSEYDKITGKGEFVFTGYFPAGEGFKIIGTLGSWDVQWGNADSDGIDNPVHNDGGSKNFAVPASGWYTVTLNTVENKLDIKEKAEAPAAAFENMEVIGSFNDWADDGTIALTQSGGAASHIWYGDVSFAADGKCKFRTRSGESATWWGTIAEDPMYFPFATTGDKDILYKAGNYTVVFNDLDKCYYFFEKE